VTQRLLTGVPARSLLPPCSHPRTIMVFNHSMHPYIDSHRLPRVVMTQCLVCYDILRSFYMGGNW
jgi:hypothetical protein